jgi:lipoate-protein ligase A
MKLLELSYPSPALNLAADEALLDWAEADASVEVLRFWESPTHFVVVGYGNSIAKEANVEECKRLEIPIFRRCSGGGTVVQGPGCLNYSVILQVSSSTELQSITDTNCYVMRKQRDALAKVLGREVKIRGTTDLTVGGLKFSGNAQRRKRQAILFHGAFLLDFELGLIERTLRMPSREPDYRKGRSHGEFVKNIELRRAQVIEALRQEWNANEPISLIPPDFTDPLRAKYESVEWNQKF